jgi:two-component system, NarL family, sensor histidine kinase DevS
VGAVDERVRHIREAVAIAATGDLDAGLRALVSAAARVSGVSQVVLELTEPDGTVRSVVPSNGDVPAAVADAPGLEEVAVPTGSRLHGRLTLVDGPTAPRLSAIDVELVGILAGVAGLLVSGARVHELVRDRERWLDAVHSITSALLEEAPLDDVLRSTTRQVRRLVGADLATVAVPAGPHTLVLRAADGRRADDIEGVEFPLEDSISGEAIRTGEPIRAADLALDPRAAQPVVRLKVFGPALFAPLAARGRAFGTLLVANMRGGAPFDDADLTVVSTIASHASLAVEYAGARDRLQRLTVLEERERIATELHESVIQRVFDTGLSIEDVAMRLGEREPELAQRLTGAVDQLDQVARDIRTAIFAAPEPTP